MFYKIVFLNSSFIQNVNVLMFVFTGPIVPQGTGILAIEDVAEVSVSVLTSFISFLILFFSNNSYSFHRSN